MPDHSCGRCNLPLFQPELYNVDSDPGEDYELSQDHRDPVEDLRSKMEDAVWIFPAEVRNSWNETTARNVAPTLVRAYLSFLAYPALRANGPKPHPARSGTSPR